LRRLGVTPRQPRRNLILPTLSGLQQQFDLVVPDGQRYFIIELKDRSHSQIEQLYAFVAKILDYAFVYFGEGERPFRLKPNTDFG